MARAFPGSGTNYYNVGDVAPIDITGTALTVACWHKPTTTPGQSIVAKSNAAGTNSQYDLQLLSNVVRFFIGNAGGGSIDAVSGATTVTTGAWHHLCGVKNGTGAGALKVYLDGAQDGSGTSNLTIANSTQPLRFGTASDLTTCQTNGPLAEIAIWDVALSAAEIAALAKGVSPLLIRRDHLKGYWPLYAVGSTEADLSGGASPASLTGTINAADHAPVGRLLPAAK